MKELIFKLNKISNKFSTLLQQKYLAMKGLKEWAVFVWVFDDISLNVVCTHTHTLIAIAFQTSSFMQLVNLNVGLCLIINKGIIKLGKILFKY